MYVAVSLAISIELLMWAMNCEIAWYNTMITHHLFYQNYVTADLECILSEFYMIIFLFILMDKQNI